MKIYNVDVTISIKTRGHSSNLTIPKDFQIIITYRLVYHPKPLGPIISDNINNFKFGYPHLTLKEGSEVKSDHTRRFPAMISYMLVYHPKPL